MIFVLKVLFQCPQGQRECKNEAQVKKSYRQFSEASKQFLETQAEIPFTVDHNRMFILTGNAIKNGLF